MIELFSVHDTAANRFIDPFTAPTIEFAIRGFRQACETPEHQFGKFPEDYNLYHVGSFDPELGELIPAKARKIAGAIQFTGPFGNQLELEGTNDG